MNQEQDNFQNQQVSPENQKPNPLSMLCRSKCFIPVLIAAAVILGYAALAATQNWWPFGVSQEQTEDKFADWQTDSAQLTASYRNEEFGFEVRYPEGWIVIAPENSSFIRFESPNQQKEYMAYFSFDSLRFYIDESKIETEVINNIQWEWFKVNFEDDEFLTFRTRHNNYTYEFESYTLYEAELRQILSTFRFLD